MRSERLSFFVWGRARSPPLPPIRYGTGRIQRGEGGFFPLLTTKFHKKKQNDTNFETRLYVHDNYSLKFPPPPACLNITRSAPRCQGTPRVLP